MFSKSTVSKKQKKILKHFPQFDGFRILRLKDFMTLYKGEIYDSDYEFEIKKKNKESPYEILCLVDCRKGNLNTMRPEKRRQYRRAGVLRRRKMQRQYHYTNVFNRIHGYVALESLLQSEKIPKGKKAVSLSLICSSSFSNKKGIGSCLMEFMITICKTKFTDIILEVANEFATEEDSDEESEEEDDYDEEYDSEEEEEESELCEINEEIVEKLGQEFLRKSLRQRINSDGHNEPYYNLGEEYIEDIIYSYMNDEYEVEDYSDDFISFDLDNPGEYDYGGFYYKKGKESQIQLFQFYEKFGFTEMPEINYEWKVFTPDPFPTMILPL